MKKKSAALILIATLVFSSMIGCGFAKKEVDAKKEKTKEEEVEVPNANEASYEDVLNYLIAKGAIQEGLEGININETKGYL
ncbi:MAG: hypothetical protein K6A30_07440 [Lachnospiraceae bacterium]|nr:hypothetical protein [Lachnospiraceae bacterium]